MAGGEEMMESTNILKSETTKELFAAFVKFQSEMPMVTMDSEVEVATKTGGSYRFSYATLNAIVDTAKPILAKNGLAVTQLLGRKSIVTLLTHQSGEYIGSEASLVFDPSDPQKLGSLITYLRRYAYSAILGVVSDEDDDGNTATGNEATKTMKREQEKTGGYPITNPDDVASTKQMDFLRVKYRDGTLSKAYEDFFGKPLADELTITKAQASQMIDGATQWHLKQPHRETVIPSVYEETEPKDDTEPTNEELNEVIPF